VKIKTVGTWIFITISTTKKHANLQGYFSHLVFNRRMFCGSFQNRRLYERNFKILKNLNRINVVIK
jgi:hypothetical protein